MLRRDRQIRAQIHQLADAMLFAFSFWLAYALRTNPQIIAWLRLDPVSADTTFDNLAWLFLALIIGRPLILESQNFYNRAPLCPRANFLWPLSRAACSQPSGWR
jgi:hypothetical protein